MKKLGKKKVYNVDFYELENTSYKGLNNLGKEIVDKVIEHSKHSESEDKPTSKQVAVLDLVKASFELLTEKQKIVLNLLFGLSDGIPLTVREVAARLKISHVSVHGIKERAIHKLRKNAYLNEKVLKSVK